MTNGQPPAQSSGSNDDERTVYLGSRNVAPPAQQPHPPAHSQYAGPQSPGGHGQYGWGNQATVAPQSGGGSKVAMIAVAVVVAVIAVATLTFAFTHRGGAGDRETNVTGDPTSAADGKPTEKSADQAPAPSTEQTPAPAPSAPTVPPSEVNSLLMTIPEAAEALHTGPMVGREGFGDKIYTISKSTIVDQDCISVLPAQLATYQGSGYTDLAQQFLSSTTEDIKLTQSAVTFTDAAAAFRFVTATKAKWEKCAGRTLNFQTAGDPTLPDLFFVVGQMTQTDGKVNLVRTQEGQGDWRCQNALSSRNNVVIDLIACGDGMEASTANNAVDKIAQKVTAAAH